MQRGVPVTRHRGEVLSGRVAPGGTERPVGIAEVWEATSFNPHHAPIETAEPKSCPTIIATLRYPSA